MEIGLNIKLLRNRNKFSQEEVSKNLNLYRSTYSGYENGVSIPGIDILIKIADYYQISVDDLCRNDFTKFSEKEWVNLEKKYTTDIKGQKLRVLTAMVDQNNEELVELIPIKASAGYVSGYADPEYLKILPTFHLPFLSKHKKYRSFPIKGDSMPPVYDGSYVTGEFIQDWNTIKSGTPCIIVTLEDGIVFKVVNNMIKEKQSFQLCSTNPIYKPYMIHVDQILEIWKFVNYISEELPEIIQDEKGITKSINEIQKDIHQIQQKLNFS
ncbi:MAG: helix-turn-helix domain-containing protein [Crocinitomicaceae bacterium]|nr:helix-turn-helix domain-containing protein [Crocinitomicaceae bacterium]